MSKILMAPILAALLSQGCFRDAETLGLWGEVYTLKPIRGSVPIDLKNTEIVGYCSTEEKVEISRCLGRIPVTNLFVSQISILWPEERLAAEVIVPPRGGR